MSNMLIVCNLQNDYLEGGSYSTKGSLKLITVINRIKKGFKHVIFINNKHPFNHISFNGFGGNKPVHCVKNTTGCKLHPDISVDDTDYLITKGTLTLHD